MTTAIVTLCILVLLLSWIVGRHILWMVQVLRKIDGIGRYIHKVLREKLSIPEDVYPV